jgi:GWxTD domain-containing protein
VKNFWTSCARSSAAVALAVLVLIAAAPALAKKKDKKPSDPAELFNPFLGIDHSHWLLGAVVEIATLEEVEAYLALTSDEEAASFVESFWAKRAEGVGVFEKKPRQVFDARATEADKRFSEGAFPGRRTDRGKIYILYGEPEEVTFDIPRQVNVPTNEVWKYPKDAPPGLHGEKPKKEYRFIELDGEKVLYTGQRIRENPLDRERRRREIY